MIPYGKQTIERDDIDAVVEALKSDWLTQGPKVEEFERALATYCGAAHAVVLNNGTSALLAAYYAAGLTSGDEMISTPLTFAATTNAALWFRAVPCFADVMPTSGSIDPDAVEHLISPKTRVIVPVDFAGHPAELGRLTSLARKHGLVVIEDGCHALGGIHKGRPIGSISDMTVFSFHPVKSITTGEGGAILTNNPDYYERARQFRSHGMVRDGFVNRSPGPWYHEMQDLGLNLRLTDFQSALGLSQLKKLPRFLERRREIAARYREAFQHIADLRPIVPSAGDESAWHLFAVELQGKLGGHRDAIFKELRRRGVGVQLHYIPVHTHPFYNDLGYSSELCPRAVDLSGRMLSLPIYPTLSTEDQDRVIEVVKDVLTECA